MRAAELPASGAGGLAPRTSATERHSRATGGGASLAGGPLALLALLLALSASAVEPRAFPSPELAERYRALVDEIRCLVCQNQTIADSDANLARDLRDKVDEMLRAGHSDDEILAYMVARYGNFVRYRPPFDAATALLWLGPFALVGVALGWLVVRVRKRALGPEELTGEEQLRLARIVGGGPDPDSEPGRTD